MRWLQWIPYRPKRSEKLLSAITADDIDESLDTDTKRLVRYEAGVSVRSNPAHFGAALRIAGRDDNSDIA